MEKIPNTLLDFLNLSFGFFEKSNGKKLVIPSLDGICVTLPVSFNKFFLEQERFDLKYVALKNNPDCWPHTFRSLHNMNAIIWKNNLTENICAIFVSDNKEYMNVSSPAFWEDHIIPEKHEFKHEFKYIKTLEYPDSWGIVWAQAKNKLLFDIFSSVFIMHYFARKISNKSLFLLGLRDVELYVLPYFFMFDSLDDFVSHEIFDIGPCSDLFSLPFCLEHCGKTINLFEYILKTRSSFEKFSINDPFYEKDANVLLTYLNKKESNENFLIYYLQCAQRKNIFWYISNFIQKNTAEHTYFIPTVNEFPNSREFFVRLVDRKSLIYLFEKTIIEKKFFLYKVFLNKNINYFFDPFLLENPFLCFKILSPVNKFYYIGVSLRKTPNSSIWLDPLFWLVVYNNLISYDSVLSTKLTDIPTQMYSTVKISNLLFKSIFDLKLEENLMNAPNELLFGSANISKIFRFSDFLRYNSFNLYKIEEVAVGKVEELGDNVCSFDVSNVLLTRVKNDYMFFNDKYPLTFIDDTIIKR